MSLRERIRGSLARAQQRLERWGGQRHRRFHERREVVERSRSATWQVAVAVLAVTVGAAALGYLAVQLFFLPETVAQSRLNRVPDLTGRDVENAIEYGEDAGYAVIESGGQFSDDVDRGEVLYQIPPPESYLQRGDTLWVLTSLGESTPTIPDLAGVEPRIARSILARLGVEITASRRESSDLHPQGMVTQTIPPAGTPIEEGVRVTLVLSRGGSFLEMPDVTDLPLVQARDSLESFGLTVGEVTGVEEDQATGEGSVVVVSQDPAPYRRVRAGSAVRLRLGEAQRAPTPTPEERVPDEPETPAALPEAEPDDEDAVEPPGPEERRRVEEERRRREAERADQGDPDQAEPADEEEPDDPTAEPDDQREARPIEVPEEPAVEPVAPPDTTP